MNRCYLCDSTDLRSRSGEVRDNPKLGILECVSCGLVMLSDRDHIGDAHYAEGRTHVSDPASAAHQSMDSWLRITEADDRRRFEDLRTLITNQRVLDFGCGAGGFLSLARSAASAVAGIELEERVHDHWKGRLPLFRSPDDVREQYDVVTAFHVVEHLHDPRAMLRALAERLRAGGRLVVEVPSASDALITLYDSTAFQRFTYWSEHLFLFTPSTLRTLAQQAGLDVLTVQQVQRYPLSNHLYWLSRGKPGGHREWGFLDTPALTAAYAAALGASGLCDTIVAHLGARRGGGD